MINELIREAIRELTGRLTCAARGLSQPLREADFYAIIAGKQTRFTHSRFNPAWLPQLVPTSGAILDLGAFDGGDAYRFSQVFPKARVLSVEADPYRFEYVANRLSGTRVEVIHSAVCDTDGTICWFAADEGRDAQGSIYRHTDSYKHRFPLIRQAIEPQRVPALRLDTLCSNYSVDEVVLLHMDVEGAEYAALSGLGDVRPALIWAELCDGRFVGSKNIATTRRLLDKLGYRPIFHFRHDSLYSFRS